MPEDALNPMSDDMLPGAEPSEMPLLADAAVASETPLPEDPHEREGRHGVGLVAIALMGVHLLARCGGLIQKVVLAHFFGTTQMGDVAAAVEKVFQTIYYIPEELLTHSLLPVFNRVRKSGEGEAAAWRVASLTGTLQAILLVVVTVLGMLFTRQLCLWVLDLPKVADPKYLSELAKFNTTVYVVRISFIGLFCTSLGSLTYVVLNAYKRFVSPAMGDVAQKLGIVVGIIVMSVGFGQKSPIGYALGFILGGVFKLVTHLIALGPKLRFARPGFDFKNPALKELGLLMLPLLGGSLISKGRDLVEFKISWVASQMVPGTSAALDFARKLVWTPVNILPYALGIALFPFLADWALRRERDKVTNAFLSSSRNMVFLFAPMTLLCLLMGPQIITFTYKSGKFDAASVALTTAVFNIYAAGMIFYALEIIALQVFYAHRDTKTPFWIGLGASILQIWIAYTMGIRAELGSVGIAMGFCIAKTVKVGFMWHYLQPRLSAIDWNELKKMLIKTAIACAVLTTVVLCCRGMIAHVHRIDLGKKSWSAVFLGGVGTLSLLSYFGTALLLGMDEVKPLVAKLARKIQRRR